MNITVETTESSVVITLPSSIDPIDLQNGLRYFKFIDISSRSMASEDDIENLSKSVKAAMSKPIIDKLKELDEFKITQSIL